MSVVVPLMEVDMYSEANEDIFFADLRKRILLLTGDEEDGFVTTTPTTPTSNFSPVRPTSISTSVCVCFFFFYIVWFDENGRRPVVCNFLMNPLNLFGLKEWLSMKEDGKSQLLNFTN